MLHLKTCLIATGPKQNRHESMLNLQNNFYMISLKKLNSARKRGKSLSKVALHLFIILVQIQLMYEDTEKCYCLKCATSSLSQVIAC